MRYSLSTDGINAIAEISSSSQSDPCDAPEPNALLNLPIEKQGAARKLPGEEFAMKKRAVLKVENRKESFDRVLSALTRTPKKYPGMHVISFPDFKTLGKVTSGAKIQVLSTIWDQKPVSIQELARMVGRDFKSVYLDVKTLAKFGLIDLKRKGPGRAMAPVAKFAEIVLAG